MNSIIESVLVKYLGKYIDGLKNSLNIGIINGLVKIQNVSLKPSFVNELGLPFTLKFSHIEKININIPWTSLKEKNTIVQIEGIYVLLNISYQQIEDEVDPNYLLKGLIQRIKMVKSQMQKKWSEGNKQQTFAQKNLIRIVDNAIVKINNIHIRLQSYCRNWDYSFGVIMDNIQSYTVDQNEQKTFYHRHFSQKQKNLPFKKILQIQRLQLYFNDQQTVFISNYSDRKRQFLIRMMAHPFPKRDFKDSGQKKKQNQQIQSYPSYSIKNLTTIRMTAVGSQKFAADMRYIVELSVLINSIDISLNSRQLSQIFHCIQHFYDYGLNIVKNGRKGYNFDENTQKYFKNVITKIVKQQKITTGEQAQLLGILKDVPISILQNITDDIINTTQFQKQVKKIAQVRNSDKSRKKMQQLLDKKQKLQAMQGIQIFKQVLIDTKIYRINLSICDLKDIPMIDFTIIGIFFNVDMDLSGQIKINTDIKNAIVYANRKQITIDLFDITKSFLTIQTSLSKGHMINFQLNMLKKQFRINQLLLLNLKDWVSMIRLKPPLMNYILQQLNYSIDITRVMMRFLCAKHRKINIQIQIPIFRLNVTDNQFLIDLGSLGCSSDLGSSIFKLQFMNLIDISCNQINLAKIQKGISIKMCDKTQKKLYQQIQFQLPNIKILQSQYAIKKIYQLTINDFFKKLNELSLNDNSTDEFLDGQFYLNKIKQKLNAKISKSQLIFYIKQNINNFPEQKISLIRTRIYRLISQKRYFIVFKQQVNKQVNIIQAQNQKAMKTIFIKLKDYIQQISTAFQWQKYYQQIYKQDILTLQQIQDINLNNNILMTLTIKLQRIQVVLAKQAEIKLKKVQAKIFYNQFNTQALLSLAGLDLNINKQSVISDTSFNGKYQSLQSKIVSFQINKFNYQVQLFSTFSKIISISSQYQLFVQALKSQNNSKPKSILQQDQQRLANIKSQNNRADNINKFLLEFKIILNMTNIDGEILKYKNKMAYLKMQVYKNRNQPHPSIIAQFRDNLIFSMIQIPIVSILFTPYQITFDINSINSQIDMQTIVYEIVKGQGSLILKQVIKSIRNKKIAKLQKNKIQNNSNISNIKNLNGKINDVRIQLKVTNDLNLGISMKNLQLINGRFSWNQTLFWLNNQCISLIQNNGIIKWNKNIINICMTNFKLKINSKEILFLIYQIKKIDKFFRNNKFDVILFVQQQFNHPDQKGRVAVHSQKLFSIRIQQVQVVYQCGDKNPLISIRFKPVFFTNQGNINSINISLWHLNRSLKLYQPIIQQLQLKILQKMNYRQIELGLQQMYIILTQQCLIDCLNQIKLLQKIQNQLSKDESFQLQQMGPQQIDINKQEMLQKPFQYYQSPDFHQSIQYSVLVKVINRLGSAAIVQIFCGKKQKQRLMFEADNIGNTETKAIYIPQKTSYHHSYQLIQRYQKVQLKICLMNQFYSARAITTSFLLYDKDNYYIKPVTFVDSNGIQIQSRIAIKVTYTQGVYLIDLIGKYGIVSQVSIPLYFRYSDACSINKFTLNNKQQLLLPPWMVDYVTFSLKQGDYDHILRLKPQNQSQTAGWFILSMPIIPNKSKVQFVIHKQSITERAKQSPKLRYLRQKSQDQKIIDDLKDIKKGQLQNKQIKLDNPLTSLFIFKIIPGILLYNHIGFPIQINNIIFDIDQQKQLNIIYLQNNKQYLIINLGDGTFHQIYLPYINQTNKLNLKLNNDNYINLSIKIRKNKIQQRIIHIYNQVHLIINLPHLFQPSIITNIYQHKFIVKKQVKNNYTDKPHPSPILKDKFCFNTSHYLLNLQEKYTTIKINGSTSNQFILFHSDFDNDLILKSDASGEIQSILAVSYECRHILLENSEIGKKQQILQCYRTFIMPKYYIINRSQQTFIINGSILIRTGQKITINQIKYLDINIRDQFDFKYYIKNIDTATYIAFIRGNIQIQQISNKADIDSQQKINNINQQFNNLQPISTITQVSIENTQNNQYQNNNKQQDNNKQNIQGLQDIVQHKIDLKDIQIFAINKRLCQYNTICYQINQWNQWLNIINYLNHTIIVRIKFNQDIVIVQHIPPSATGKIIAGISDLVEISLLYQRTEIILGQFQLDQRLNHTFFLNECGYQQINLKQTKIKVGRMMTIDCPKSGNQQNIHKVQNSISFKIQKIRISFVFNQQKQRRQLIRFSLLHVNIVGMKYKNGLYMCHLQLGGLNGIYKRVSFLVLKSFYCYIEGVQGQFIQRLNININQILEITLTDQLIVSLIDQIQSITKIIPINSKSNNQQINFQEEQTYHLNSLSIKPIQIKFCMRKRISDMTQRKNLLLSKLGLSIVEVQDAHIHLSSVQIATPLKQKHINQISKTYTMQSFIGVASGLNILGNPSQFASQFSAGRNKGGIFPFFRSIVSGTSNSVSKIIGTIGSGVSQLTFDRKFMKQRIENKNIKAENFGMGLKIGLKQLAHSVKSGLAGVVQQPLQGHREDGGIGAIKGAVAGFTGLITKPLTGLIFAASKAIQGVNSSITYLDIKRLQRQELITRPLYHKFKLVRPYKSEDELAYNILLNWWQYSDVELVAGYLLENEEGDSIVDILIITCSELILIDLETKEVALKLKIEQLLATGKFTEGVVLYYQDGESEEDQDQIVFRLQNDPIARDNLFWTLKGFIGLYAQKQQ